MKIEKRASLIAYVILLLKTITTNQNVENSTLLQDVYPYY